MHADFCFTSRRWEDCQRNRRLGHASWMCGSVGTKRRLLSTGWILVRVVQWCQVTLRLDTERVHGSLLGHLTSTALYGRKSIYRASWPPGSPLDLVFEKPGIWFVPCRSSLTEFRFKIRHRSPRKNVVADVLFRLQSEEMDENDLVEDISDQCAKELRTTTETTKRQKITSFTPEVEGPENFASEDRRTMCRKL